MGEKSTEDRGANARAAPRSGWWWKFTALFMGAPPIAVWGAEEEVEQERAAKAKRLTHAPRVPRAAMRHERRSSQASAAP